MMDTMMPYRKVSLADMVVSSMSSRKGLSLSDVMKTCRGGRSVSLAEIAVDDIDFLSQTTDDNDGDFDDVTRIIIPGSAMCSAAAASVVLGMCVVSNASPVDLHMGGMCRGIGLQPLIDVTVPHGPSFSEILAVLYSFVPWIVSAYIVGGAVFRRTSTLLAGMTYVASVVICNEVLVKRNFPQRRPLASCLVSPGMPSSHSLLAMGLLVWILLEMLERGIRSWKWLAVVVVLLPVPPSRVILNDHSMEQVAAGSLFGIATALLFYVAIRHSAPRSLDVWCAHPYARRLGIVNDYIPSSP